MPMLNEDEFEFLSLENFIIQRSSPFSELVVDFLNELSKRILKSKMTWWNFYCYKCKWKGAPQDLVQDHESELGWICPACGSDRIEDMGWHKEADENTRD